MSSTSTAPKRRKYSNVFTTEQHQYYITLYFLGRFVGNFDDDKEIEEAKLEVLDGVK